MTTSVSYGRSPLAGERLAKRCRPRRVVEDTVQVPAAAQATRTASDGPAEAEQLGSTVAVTRIGVEAVSAAAGAAAQARKREIPFAAPAAADPLTKRIPDPPSRPMLSVRD